MSLLTDIREGDIEGVKWAKLQRWLRLACDNAGISYSMSYPLTDINPGDTEGVKWAKLGAWMKLLAENITGGGGGGNVKSGTENLAQGDTSKAITFTPAFSGDPEVIPTILAPDGLSAIEATVDDSTLTANGCTIRFPEIPAAGFKLSWIANRA